MAVYVFDRASGSLVDKDTREPVRAIPHATVSAPNIQSDYEGYQSPVTGDWIEGKAARNEDLKRHNCIDARDFAPAKPRKLKNKRFIKKHGLQHLS